MKRKVIFLFLALFFSLLCFSRDRSGKEEREIWVRTLTEIAGPVLTNLSRHTLRQHMPVEVTEEGKTRNREQVAHLEAVGRLMCGIAPWLELGPDPSPEGQLREDYMALCTKALSNAVDPSSPDLLDFRSDRQALVDAAFLAQGFLRAPVHLWGKLDKVTQARIIGAFKSTRSIKPLESNWLLFSAMIEVFLLKYENEWNPEVVHYAIGRFDEWYKGDGWYGDGPRLHFDYYNSFVIHPMLMDILQVLEERDITSIIPYETARVRFVRYAEQLERLISPEGTYPLTGRSVIYRFGAFHALSQAALMRELPEYILPAQVRCALTSVIENQCTPDTFDENGWLRPGFCGYQPELAESYISTGSLYLCSVVFLPLGLPADDPFWQAGFTPWTNRRAWYGEAVRRDKSIKE